MTETRAQRRLAAILAADVVNYSALMGQDETGTRNRFNAVLSDVVRPALDDHSGRLFKEMGDGLLAEFGSVVDAVDCAVRIQTALAADPGSPIVLRIGINLGDVIVEGDDLHGDGVNVAARLEALADPGGIALSRAARDQIRDKLSYTIDDLGEVQVKNIARPVRVFSLRNGTSDAPPARPPAAPRRMWLAVAAALVAGAALLAGWLYSGRMPVADVALASAMSLPLPEEPSVAVLPFQVTSTTEGDRAFADALSQDLIRGLARIPGLFVIAYSSTQQYAGQTVTAAQVAAELGVGHVVRASLRRADGRIRLDAEMVDALTGRLVFSDRYDRPTGNLFDLQDKLVQDLAFRLSADLDRISEQPRFTSSPEAYLLWAQADHESWTNTPAAYGKATAMARQALTIDPGLLRAHGVLAFIESQRGWFRMADDPQGAIDSALQKARALVAQQPDDWYLQSVLAQAVFNARDYEAAAVEYQRAIEMEPGQPRLLTRAAPPLIFLGRADEAESRLRIAMRLNPFHDWLPNQLLGQALFIKAEYEDAARYLERARTGNPNFIGNKWWRAATYGALGQIEAAEEAVAEILEAAPDSAISTSFIRISRPDAMARFQAGLKAAGLPD